MPEANTNLEMQIRAMFEKAATDTVNLVRDLQMRVIGGVVEPVAAVMATPVAARNVGLGDRVKAALALRNKCPLCGKPGKGPRFGFHCEDHRGQFKPASRK